MAQLSINAIARAYLRDAYRQGFADGCAKRASRECDDDLDYSTRQQLAYAIGYIVGLAQDRYDNPWKEQ